MVIAGVAILVISVCGIIAFVKKQLKRQWHRVIYTIAASVDTGGQSRNLKVLVITYSQENRLYLMFSCIASVILQKLEISTQIKTRLRYCVCVCLIKFII